MKRILTFLLLAVLTLSACGKNESADAEKVITATVGEQINEKSSDEIVLAMRTTTTLNPLLNEDASVDSILRILYRPVIDLDESGKPEPSIAESWYYTEDGTALVLKLRQNMKWHDGSSITADDIIYSINVLKAAGENVVYKNCVQNITNCVKTDTYSLEVHFTNAYSGNVYSMCFLPVSQKWNSGGGKDLEPMGNGSYRFESFTAAKELVLKAAENSFGEIPTVETVTVRMTTDKDTDVYSFSQRLTDCLDASETQMGKHSLEDGAKKYSYVSNYYDFIGFNFNNSILAEKNIRKAVAYAVPIESIIDGIYLSNAVRTSNPVSPDSYLYESEAKTYDYSLDGAKKYLDVAGFKAENDTGVRKRTKDGEVQSLSFGLLVNSENDERAQIARKMAEELRAVGFEAKVESVPFEEYVQRLENGDFDMFVGGWEMSVAPYPGFMFSSSQIGGTNYISYSSEKMDSLLSAAYSAVSNASLLEAYSALQKEIAEELPYVSLVYRKSALFTDDRISGNVVPYKNDCYKTIGQWKID